MLSFAMVIRVLLAHRCAMSDVKVLSVSDSTHDNVVVKISTPTEVEQSIRLALMKPNLEYIYECQINKSRSYDE